MLFIGFSAGCSGFPGILPPTFIPEEHLPTVIELTAQALVDEGVVQVTPFPTATQSLETPTETPVPTATQPPPSPTINLILKSPQPLTLPDPIPSGVIQIIQPGRLSRVDSPFKIHVYFAPPPNEQEEKIRYQIFLFGEDGRLLFGLIDDLDDSNGGNIHFNPELSFQIPKEAESARLEIRMLDAYGRTSALSSTDLVLLTDGETDIKPVQDLYENLVIQQPVPSTLIQGGVLILQGITRFAPQDQLLVELINREGELVGSDLLPVSDNNLGSGYKPFEGEIPFQVGSSSWIRVQVSANDQKFSGIQHLSSVEVLVSP
jgi:hypothetical protein